MIPTAKALGLSLAAVLFSVLVGNVAGFVFVRLIWGLDGGGTAGPIDLAVALAQGSIAVGTLHTLATKKLGAVYLPALVGVVLAITLTAGGIAMAATANTLTTWEGGWGAAASVCATAPWVYLWWFVRAEQQKARDAGERHGL